MAYITADEIIFTVLCDHLVGSPPWWMSEYQWDPCSCVLPKGHSGLHKCSHIIEEERRQHNSTPPTGRIASERTQKNGS